MRSAQVLALVSRPGRKLFLSLMHVTLLAAQSLDGFITRQDTPGSGFTSPEDKAYFRRVLAGFDCSVTGGVTYRLSRDLHQASLVVQRLRMVLTRTPEQHAADTRPGTLEFTSEAPGQLLASLRARGFARCAVLGGAQVHSLFFAAGLIDEAWLTVEPVLFGGGTPLLATQASVQLELQSSEKLNAAGTLLLRYRVLR